MGILDLLIESTYIHIFFKKGRICLKFSYKEIIKLYIERNCNHFNWLNNASFNFVYHNIFLCNFFDFLISDFYWFIMIFVYLKFHTINKDLKRNSIYSYNFLEKNSCGSWDIGKRILGIK